MTTTIASTSGLKPGDVTPLGTVSDSDSCADCDGTGIADDGDYCAQCYA